MGNWLLCFAVMSLNFELYKQITLGALIYILFVAVFYNIFKLMYAAYQTLSIIDNDKKRCFSKLERIEKLQHTNTFIVPNYKENIDVIRRTLQALADH
jgi:cellulose synthase/poly-beta-1,6-N-acetylglucosamine synthase-like glycosyltransferase